jgi:hypothetical protein
LSFSILILVDLYTIILSFLYHQKLLLLDVASKRPISNTTKMSSSSPPPPAPPAHGRTSHGANDDDETQYSLDLDALNLDDAGSALDSPSLHGFVDKIHSDDIDGPTDFTVNLLKYFGSTPVQNKHKTSDELPRLDSHHGHVDALGQATKSLLQPTVEDYYSELTPGRAASLRPTPDAAAGAGQRRSYSTSRLRQSQSVRRDSPSGGQGGSIHFGESTSNQKSHSLYHQVQKLTTVNESLQSQLRARSDRDHELSTLRHDLDRVRRESQDHHYRMKQLQSDLDKSRASEKHALSLAEERAKDLNQFHDTEDAEIHNLHLQLSQSRDAERLTHTQLDKIKEELRIKDAQLAEVRRELKQAQDNLRETENDMQDLKTWNEGQRKAKLDELHRVQHDLFDAREEALRARDGQAPSSKREQELEAQLASLEARLQDMRDHITIKDKLIAELNSRIENEKPNRDLERELQQAQHALVAKEKAVQSAHEKADSIAAEMTRELAQQLQQAKQRLAAHETDSNAEAILNHLQTQLQKARDDLLSIQQQYASDKEAWTKTNTEAQQSHTNFCNHLKKEQESHKQTNQEINTLREEINMLQQLNRIEERPKPPLPVADINTVHFTKSLRKDLQALKQQLESQQHEHHEEVERLRMSLASSPQLEASALQIVRAEHARTLDLIEQGMSSLRTTRDTLSLRVNGLETQIQTTTAQLLITEGLLSQTQTSLSNKTSELETLTNRSSVQTTELQETQSRLEKTTKELTELHALTATFDTQISETLKKREDTWKTKVKMLKEQITSQQDKILLLQQERKRMVKALMGSWGRQEFPPVVDEDVDVGVDVVDGLGKDGKGEQKFRYKFAGKNLV